MKEKCTSELKALPTHPPPCGDGSVDVAAVDEYAAAIILRNISDVAYQLRVESGARFRFVNVNPAFYRTTQLTPAQVIGKLVQEVIPEPSQQLVLSHYAEAIRTGTTQRWEETSQYPGGRKVGQVSITPVFDEKGRCTDLVGTVHDISELSNREDQLNQALTQLAAAMEVLRKNSELIRNNELRLRLALEGTGEGVWDWDIERDQIFYSKKWNEIRGIDGAGQGTRDEWLGRVHPEDLPAVVARLEAVLHATQQIYSCEYRLLHESQQWIWVRSRGSIVERDRGGRPVRMIGTMADITQSHQLRRDLESTHNLLTQLARQVPGALFELHIDTAGNPRCTYISAMANELFERTPEELMSDCGYLFDRIVPEDRPRIARALKKSCERLSPLRLEFEVNLPRQGRRWREVTATPTRSSDGMTIMHGFTDDISQRKASEATIRHFHEKLERRAHYDALTGLPNRALFRDRLEQGIRQAESAGGQIALLFIDLDRFKEVNDLLGHDAGDALLVEAARRIENCVGHTDTVARLGGDEFTVILTEVPELAHIEQIAQQILNALAMPFQVKAEQVHAAGSIGIARFPEDAADSEELMRNADHAMYRSKSGGRNRLTFFEATMQSAALRRLKLISDLRRALPEDRLRLYFQPIVELRTNRIIKAEALLRWRRSAHELIGPIQFIEVAEESGLMHEIGNWVFRSAADYAKRWSDLIGQRFQISINKSPSQFSPAPHSMNWIEYLHELGIPAGCINVEITEGLLLNLSEHVFAKLAELQTGGFEMAIDDFGTGYSSMSYLKRLDIDYLKIDQSFVAEMLFDQTSSTITETIIVMAHKLGIKVIAEGVETIEQRDWLVRHGCDFGQGFLFAKPLPAEGFEQMLVDLGRNLPGSSLPGAH